MKFLSWLKDRRARQPNPEAEWIVAFDDDVFEVTSPGGEKQRLAQQDLSGIVIETNDTGPWGADVWWLLFGRDDRVACAYPQGASGEQRVLDTLMALPDFNHAEMGRAMQSTDNATFPVWRIKRY